MAPVNKIRKSDIRVMAKLLKKQSGKFVRAKTVSNPSRLKVLGNGGKWGALKMALRVFFLPPVKLCFNVKQ